MPKKRKNEPKGEVEEMMTDSGRVKYTVATPGWPIIKDRVFALINDAQSIMGVEAKDAEAMLREIEAKRMAINLITEWIREIEGEAAQYDQEDAALYEEEPDEYIKIAK